MSDSDEGALQIDIDGPVKSSAKLKKSKLKRFARSLKLSATEDEIQYRAGFKDFDVVKEFPDLIKCTKCLHSFKTAILEGKKIHSHPLLQVLMCETCCAFYGSGEFSLDEDGEDKYCRWCGEGGKIFLCSECIYGFCPQCIKKHFGKGKVREIERDDEWLCFICNPKPLWKMRVVCSLAKDQSLLNKTNNDAQEKETPRKGRANPRQSKHAGNASHEDTSNYKGDSNNEDSPSSSKETLESYGRTANSKRKRFLATNVKGKRSKVVVDDGLSDDNAEPPKKMRPTVLREKGKQTVIEKRSSANGKDVVSSSSSSDSSDDDNENDDTTSHDVNEKELSAVARKKNKNLDKLRDIFTVAETVSELCLSMCKKKIKKLDKNLLSDEKLLPECEKLRSMIILMSCSLSTVYNMIVSLQKKCKKKEKLDIQFCGKQDSTLLEAISKILRDKKMKNSYFFDIVSDILNRYPFIELGAKNFSNYLSNSVLVENRLGPVGNDTGQNVTGNFCGGIVERNEQNSNSTSVIRSITDTVIRGNINSDFISTKGSSEKVNRETDVSNQIPEASTSYISSNNEASGRSIIVKPSNALSMPLQGNNALKTSPDSDKMYSESVKLRKELLLSSSDEEERSVIVNTNSLRKSCLTRVTNTAKEQIPAASTEKSKEERELSRLMDLSSLERSRRKEDSRKDPSEESNSAGKNLKVPSTESNRSKVTASDTFEEKSLSDTISEADPCDLTLNKRHTNSMDYVLENASVIKNYFLETSSSNDSNEDSSSDEKPKKTRSSARSSDKVAKPNVKKNDKSDWRSDKLLRASLSFPSPNRNSDALKQKQGSVIKSTKEEDRDASDSSASSLNVGCVENRKRPRIFLNSSSDSDSAQEPEPKVDSPPKGRRNIKKIVKTGNLQLETRQAVKMENERKKRVAERKLMYEESFPNMLESDRLVLDFDPETRDVLLEVPEELAKKLKPHQKEGVKFMWDCCFESLDSLEQSNGSGCILAHCMGLGKTLQIIALIFTVMKNGIGIKTILILCPLNVVSNWIDEFSAWLNDLNSNITVFNLNNVKGDELRLKHLQGWHKEGGVMILSYDLMRNLTSANRKSKSAAEKVSYFSELLLNPGPDLVICDEGHLLKNQGTALSKCIMKINTSRRIILTGTPLQNNLIEYHSMIQFIKPNILGTKKEFMNRFGNPILNGQFEDSTANDVKLMRARSHVLHKLLDGCIQRFNYSVLTPYLPEKHEYVLSIRLTEPQAKLYQFYVDKCTKSLASNKTAKLFHDFHLLQRVWTHPRLLHAYTEQYEDQLNSDFEDIKMDSSSSDDSVICLDSVIKSSGPSGVNINDLLKPEVSEDFHSGGKLVLLLHILSGCKKAGDKVLVFSQSLNNLNLIEHFLHKIHVANQTGSTDFPPHYRDTWEKGVDYYRMEGSTNYEARTKWCKSFNNKNNTRLRLFLISTKAGGLGINMVGANRVIIFDVSWNPSHDVQSIFRVYRFGQLKTCYIYRFVAEGTMEEKIYARQVTKLSLEKRVLDEQQIERHYTMGNLQELYKYDPMPEDKWKVPLVPKDMVLAEIINNKSLIASYHEHDSLLENKEEEKLTEEERKAAWDDFERERFMMEQQRNRFPVNIANNSATTNPANSSATANPPNAEMFYAANARRPNPEHSIFPQPFLNGFYNRISNAPDTAQFQQPSCSTAAPPYIPNFRNF